MEIKRIKDFKSSLKENLGSDITDPRENMVYPETKKDTLYNVIRYPGITLKELEKKTGHNPYRISAALRELEKEGQITISGGMGRGESYKHYPVLDYEPPRMPFFTNINIEVNKQILDALSTDNMGCTISDLMELTGYNMSFIQNTMNRLEAAGRVRLEGDTYFLN